MDSHLKHLIIEKLKATIAEISENLAMTPAKTFEEYRLRVGYVQGLMQAIDVIDETYTEYIKG